MSKYLLFLTVLTMSLSAWADDVDWKALATETDEPSYGLEIVSVTPASQAEKLGLVPGDFFMQVGHQLVRDFGLRRSGGDDRFFFVRKGGREEQAIVKAGLIGVRFRESFRPWLGYLRGEIGRSDPAWDDHVVKALELIRKDPAQARQEWKKAIDAGYRKDELDAFVNAYTQWRLGKDIPLREAHEAVIEEFEVLPFVYYTGLEDMAIAGNELEVLRALHELDPDSSTVRSVDLDRWEKAAELHGSPKPIDIGSIEDRHVMNITSELVSEAGTDTEGLISPEFLIEKKPMGASPGNFSVGKVDYPEGLKKLHLRMKYRLVSFGNHPRFLTSTRLRLYSQTGENRSKRVAEILVEAPAGEESYLSFYSTGSSSPRRMRLQNVSIPRLENENEDFGNSPDDVPQEKAKLSELITLDVVCDDKMMALFCNGVSLSNLPHPGDLDDLAISFQYSGVGVVPEAFDVWTLK